MAKTSSKPAGKFTARGGSGKMFGKMGAKPSKGGVISQSQAGKGAKFPSGGRGKMFGKSGANPARPC